MNIRHLLISTFPHHSLGILLSSSSDAKYFRLFSSISFSSFKMSKIYAVIEFTATKTVAVVPCTWLSRNEKQCRWPPNKIKGRQIVVTSLVKSCAEKSTSWPIFYVRILGKYSTYDKAHSKMIIAETKSDLESAAEDTRRQKSKSNDDSPLASLSVPKVAPKSNKISDTQSSKAPAASTSRYERPTPFTQKNRIVSLGKSSTGKSKSESNGGSSRSSHTSTAVNERKRPGKSSSFGEKQAKRIRSPSVNHDYDDNNNNRFYIERSRSNSPRKSRGLYTETPRQSHSSRDHPETYTGTDIREILRGQKKIQIQLRENRDQLDLIRNLLMGQRRDSQKTESFPLPLLTTTDVRNLEKRLHESVDLQDWLKDEFITIGGSWLREGVRLALRKLMENGLARTYSWAGQSQKLAFKSLKMSDVLIRGMKEQYDSTDKEVQATIADCLKHTPDPEKKKLVGGTGLEENNEDEISDRENEDENEDEVSGDDSDQVQSDNEKENSEDEQEHQKRIGYSAFSDDDEDGE